MAHVTPNRTEVHRSRRRGEVLERALYEATVGRTLASWIRQADDGRIAARAHTGKAALYRRWASKHDLVHAALVFALPPVPSRARAGRPGMPC